MNRRILPFSLVVCGAILAYACSSSNGTDTPAPPPGDEGGGPTVDGAKPDEDSSTNPDGAKTDSSIPPTGNPIEGIAAPTAVPGFTAPAVPTEGPVWHTDGLYFSTTGSPSHLVKLTPPSTTDDIHAVAAGSLALGNAFDPKTSTFVSCEAISLAPSPMGLTRTPLAGGPSAPITLNFDAGGGAFDSPNDLIVRKDGTIYVTDPGYQNPATLNNHIWRVTPTGNVFETVVQGHPNGIALSLDEKTLFVSFTDPAAPAMPTITKYPLAVADGALGVGTKFTDVATAVGSLDGLAVDTGGNVYAAVVNGVDVFKADGSKWGHIPAGKINGLAFGGADHKTLFMTSDDGMFQVTVKVAGIE
jgi:gluconolactonase